MNNCRHFLAMLQNVIVLLKESSSRPSVSLGAELRTASGEKNISVLHVLPTNRERLGRAKLGKDMQRCPGSIPGHDRGAAGIEVFCGY